MHFFVPKSGFPRFQLFAIANGKNAWKVRYSRLSLLYCMFNCAANMHIFVPQLLLHVGMSSRRGQPSWWQQNNSSQNWCKCIDVSRTKTDNYFHNCFIHVQNVYHNQPELKVKYSDCLFCWTNSPKTKDKLFIYYHHMKKKNCNFSLTFEKLEQEKL